MAFQKGCEFIGSRMNATDVFEKTLFCTGENMCDSCILKDCICSYSQAERMQKIQEKYRREHISPAEMKIRKANEAHQSYLRYLAKKDGAYV